jgi:nucleotide-binding universal stress UspA family protein
MYRKLMVPLDGSTFAEHALPVARSIARRCQATLELVVVLPPLAETYAEGVVFSPVELEEEARADRLAYLEKVKQRLGEEVPITLRVLEGPISTSLTAFAATEGIDLVVMATHGRGLFGRFWLGSVADEMVRTSGLPLLLIRPETEEVDLAREPKPGKIILPLDGTPLAEQIIEPAIQVGSLLPEVEFTLMRVLAPVMTAGRVPDVPPVDAEAHSLLQRIEEMQNNLFREAEEYLETIAARLRFRGLKVAAHVVVEDQPAEAILHEAETEGASMIALETHGRSGLARFFLGSVADKVVRGAHVPVLVQKAIS